MALLRAIRGVPTLWIRCWLAVDAERPTQFQRSSRPSIVHGACQASEAAQHDCLQRSRHWYVTTQTQTSVRTTYIGMPTYYYMHVATCNVVHYFVDTSYTYC
eukprot:COSAG06_NODE_5572_length_3394_cov_224.363584_3_plen_102_part_00